VAPARGKSGLGWMRLLPDIPLVLSDLADGYLKLSAYWHSLKATRVESVFSRKDPMPSIAEFVLLPYFIKKKYSTQY
jgi:D-aspartate ligase